MEKHFSRLSGSIPLMSVPPSVICPDVASQKRAANLAAVLFPLPEGPTKAVKRYVVQDLLSLFIRETYVVEPDVISVGIERFLSVLDRHGFHFFHPVYTDVKVE